MLTCLYIKCTSVLADICQNERADPDVTAISAHRQPLETHVRAWPGRTRGTPTADRTLTLSLCYPVSARSAVELPHLTLTRRPHTAPSRPTHEDGGLRLNFFWRREHRSKSAREPRVEPRSPRKEQTQSKLYVILTQKIRYHRCRTRLTHSRVSCVAVVGQGPAGRAWGGECGSGRHKVEGSTAISACGLAGGAVTSLDAPMLEHDAEPFERARLTQGTAG